MKVAQGQRPSVCSPTETCCPALSWRRVTLETIGRPCPRPFWQASCTLRGKARRSASLESPRYRPNSPGSNYLISLYETPSQKLSSRLLPSSGPKSIASHTSVVADGRELPLADDQAATQVAYNHHVQLWREPVAGGLLPYPKSKGLLLEIVVHYLLQIVDLHALCRPTDIFGGRQLKSLLPPALRPGTQPRHPEIQDRRHGPSSGKTGKPPATVYENG